MKIIIPILLLTAGLAGAGCKKAENLHATGHVEGVVIDQTTGDPIPGAKLYVEGCRDFLFGGAGDCRPLATGITDAQGKYRITWNGDGYSKTFTLKAYLVDSAYVQHPTATGNLLINQRNYVNLVGYKGRKINVRVTVNKNEGRLLRLRFGTHFPVRGLMRPGPVDTTLAVWGFPGNSAYLFVAALDRQQENYRGAKFLVRVAPWKEAVRDTAFTIDDAMALPAMPEFQP